MRILPITKNYTAVTTKNRQNQSSVKDTETTGSLGDMPLGRDTKSVDKVCFGALYDDNKINKLVKKANKIIFSKKLSDEEKESQIKEILTELQQLDTLDSTFAMREIAITYDICIGFPI
ncbi:hypothetical protein IJ596_05965 [bacterium]|nr:hypothetical protein [bacterium]